MPPATAKSALEPDAGMTPPPVTKSPLPEQFPPPQVMSACAEETMMSATPGTVTCSAFTVIVLLDPLCSLITSVPMGTVTVWLGEPDTLIDCPLTMSPRISEEPDTDACPPLHLAVARAMRK